MAVGLAAAAPVFASFYPIVAAIGFGMGIAFPAFTSLFSRACQSGQQGELLAESQAMAMTGRMAGPLAAGFVVERVSYGAPFLGAAGITTAALGLVWWARHDLRARKARTRSQVVAPP